MCNLLLTKAVVIVTDDGIKCLWNSYLPNKDLPNKINYMFPRYFFSENNAESGFLFLFFNFC